MWTENVFESEIKKFIKRNEKVLFKLNTKVTTETYPEHAWFLINSTGDIGTCKGTSGLNYYQCYSLKPDEQVTRNILIELTEPLPRVKRLVGKVDYETDDGASGSIKSVAELIVSGSAP